LEIINNKLSILKEVHVRITTCQGSFLQEVKMDFLNKNVLLEGMTIRACRHGPKVVETPAGEIVKIFYPKKKLSSAFYKPYAKRFCENAKRLSQLKLNVPVVKSAYFCDQSKRYYVHYDKLQGEDVSEMTKAGNLIILQDVLKYVAMLHEKGIFFRALHLSNLLHQSNNEFALIDITDVRIRRRPLSLYQRYRNLCHLFLHYQDRKYWEKAGIKHWLSLYCQFAQLSFIGKKSLIHYFSYRYLQ
jgi:hypothetical protein